MKKNEYIPPELWVMPIRMESVLCTSGSGEGMDPWQDGGASFAPANLFEDFGSIL